MSNQTTISLGRDCCGQEIIPRAKKLSVHRNSHPNCDGTSWGWIEGCTLNICWANNKQFNEQRACALVTRYNNPMIDPDEYDRHSAEIQEGREEKHDAECRRRDFEQGIEPEEEE